MFTPNIGKQDKTDLKTFRPISLPAFLLRTIEKVFDNEITVE